MAKDIKQYSIALIGLFADRRDVKEAREIRAFFIPGPSNGKANDPAPFYVVKMMRRTTELEWTVPSIKLSAERLPARDINDAMASHCTRRAWAARFLLLGEADPALIAVAEKARAAIHSFFADYSIFHGKIGG
jgi:hypothetical protein